MDNKMKNDLIKNIDLLLTQIKNIDNVEKEMVKFVKNTLTLMKKALQTDKVSDELDENLDEISNYFMEDLGFDPEFAGILEDTIRAFEEFHKPGTNQLSVVVDEICNAAVNEDTLKFYTRVQACCCDCMKLVNPNLLSLDEKTVLTVVTVFWKKEKYQFQKIDMIAKKARKMIKNPNKHIKNLLLSLIMSFETKTHGYNRPYVLESFIYDLQELDLNPLELHYILTWHFPEYKDL